MKPISFTKTSDDKTVIYFSDNLDWTAHNNEKARLEFPGELYDSFIRDGSQDWKIITDWLNKGELIVGSKQS